MNRMYVLVMLLACILLPANASLKTEADKAYQENDFKGAIEKYEAILEGGQESADVYYNLGNSYYKNKDIAKAVLNYERALLLQPENGDIRANLKIANAKTIDKITPIPEIFFITWIKSLINSLNIDTWAKLGIISFMLCLIGLGTFLYIKDYSRSRYNNRNIIYSA